MENGTYRLGNHAGNILLVIDQTLHVSTTSVRIECKDVLTSIFHRTALRWIDCNDRTVDWGVTDASFFHDNVKSWKHFPQPCRV